LLLCWGRGIRDICSGFEGGGIEGILVLGSGDGGVDGRGEDGEERVWNFGLFEGL